MPATHATGSDLPSPLSRVSLRKWPFKCRLQMLPWEVACDTVPSSFDPECTPLCF